MENKKALITEILAYEWQMFITVNDRNDHNPVTDGRPSCKDFPDEFRLHRTSQFVAWSDRTLQSYLHDLQEAQRDGHNLMTYKYARMEDLIPSNNSSPLIEKISVAQLNWQQEFIEKYPKMMSRGRMLSGDKKGIDWASFKTYLCSELETYSENTLEYLSQDIITFKEQGKSMSEVVYEYLVGEKGYGSIDEAEKKQ
ncbi:MAG: DUF4125 family protein [Desulfotalea sp.]